MENEMKTSPRPKAKPLHMKRPKERDMSPEEKAGQEKLDSAARVDKGTPGMAKGGYTKKMAMGGKCRGMGAATKGGKYKA
jgi:hypothetical protein